MAEAKEAFAKLLADAQLARKRRGVPAPTRCRRPSRPWSPRQSLRQSSLRAAKPAKPAKKVAAPKAAKPAKVGQGQGRCQSQASEEGRQARRQKKAKAAPKKTKKRQSVMASGQRVSRVLLALLAGLGVGIIAGATDSPRAIAVLHAIAPLGTIWINAVRMTVVPLVIALLFTSIVDSDKSSAVGRQAGAAVATFVGILLLAVVVAATLAPGMIDDMHLSPETSAAMRASVTSSATALHAQVEHLPGIGDWLMNLVPPNAVRAAADGCDAAADHLHGALCFSAPDRSRGKSGPPSPASSPASPTS